MMVRSPEAWRVLISPVRAEIAEALRLLGPCSMAELAAAIDRPADSLYQHLELLQKAGFVVQAGFRKGTLTLTRSDFGISAMTGPIGKEVDITLSVEANKVP